jgi:hypothetical protein
MTSPGADNYVKHQAACWAEPYLLKKMLYKIGAAETGFGPPSAKGFVATEDGYGKSTSQLHGQRLSYPVRRLATQET